MAGNIIPAIATTNAVVAAMIVVEALKVLAGNFHKCKTCFIVRKANPKGKILVDTALYPPNPKCYVCSEKPEVAVELNTKTFSVKSLEEKILKQTLNMVAPDVNIADGSGSVIISSEEGETDGLAHKSLCEVRVVDGTRLMCDDFMQHFELRLIIHHSYESFTFFPISVLHEGCFSDSLPVDEEFRLINDPFNIKAEETPEIQVKGISAKNDDEGETEIVEDSPLKLKAGQKRAAPDDGGSDFADDAKRVRTNC